MCVEKYVIDAFLVTVVWFVVGGFLYMNPFTAKIYKKFQRHRSMKRWKTQPRYLIGVFLVAGFMPNLLITITHSFIPGLGVLGFGLLLVGVRIVPRLCDMWMQTSYPDKILAIELMNGIVLSFVTAFMLEEVL